VGLEERIPAALDRLLEPAPTVRIGLERTGLRLFGKVTAACVVASIIVSN
jgi:hypothetical protein